MGGLMGIRPRCSVAHDHRFRPGGIHQYGNTLVIFSSGEALTPGDVGVNARSGRVLVWKGVKEWRVPLSAEARQTF